MKDKHATLLGLIILTPYVTKINPKQCTLTAQIEPVQDKYKYMTFRPVHLKTIHYVTGILLKVGLNTIP
jgi:hypothetical protein